MKMKFKLGDKSFMNEFFESLKSESDRGLVLCTASFLDICLRRLFEKYLILDGKLNRAILEDSLAPLHTFSNKIKMAESFKMSRGLIVPSGLSILFNKGLNEYKRTSLNNPQGFCRRRREHIRPRR